MFKVTVNEALVAFLKGSILEEAHRYERWYSTSLLLSSITCGEKKVPFLPVEVKYTAIEHESGQESGHGKYTVKTQYHLTYTTFDNCIRNQWLTKCNLHSVQCPV